MKRLFTFLALVLGLVSCQTEPEGFDVNVGGEQDVNIAVSLPESTRAASNQGFDFTNFVDNNNYDLRFILEIRHNDKVVREVKTSETTSATFPVRLAPGREYTFTVWADLVKQGTVGYTPEDLFYNTTSLANITLNDVNEDFANNVELRDAYTYTDTFEFSGENREKLNMTLTRPFAKVRVVATDLDKVTDFDINPAKGVVTYSEVYTAFDAVEGDVEGNASSKGVTYNIAYNIAANTYTEQTGQLTVFADYIFVRTAENTQPTVTFTLDVKEANDKSIKSNSFNTAIPVSRNKVTSIIGDVLTQGENIDVRINGEFGAEDAYVDSRNAAQSSLDYAIDNTTIYLEEGVDYGTLYIRPVAGASNTTTDCDYLVYRNEMHRSVKNLTIFGAEGATVDAIKVVAGYVENSGNTGYVVDIENLVIDGVKFTDKHTNAPHSYAAPIFIDLTYTNVDGLTVKNCKLEGNNDKMNFVYVYGSGNPSNSTFATAAKNIVIENNTVDGIARLCELRQTENVKITNNTIKNTALHAILLPVDNGTYSGNVTITDNYTEGINERFVRMAGAGNATVVIKDNTIVNYQGADADYIKVTDGTNVTVENNTLISYISNAAQFISALNANGYYEVINDITISGPQAGTLATRANANKESVINLNGHTVTFANTGTEPIATIEAGNSVTFVGEGSLVVAENSAPAILNEGTVVDETFNVTSEIISGTGVVEYEVSDVEGLISFADAVDDGETFAGMTVKLTEDITLPEKNWNPIGDNRTDTAFSGTFDGQNHTISGAKITGDFCFDESVYGSKEGWGLFSVLDGATVKNVKLDNEVFASYTVISGGVAGYANNTTFENIEITNTKIAGYNWYTGGVVGWAQGNCTFKGINLDSSVTVGTLWDSHGQSAGGIAGGVSSSAKITIEDCNIACVMDVINDVTSNYKWWIYRVSGMIIGNTNTTETKYNEVVTATATNVTCKNVTVTYGDWMDYHYCEGYWNRGWGRYESSDYVGGVDENEPHNHAEGEEHCVWVSFDQLFGGSANGSGHYPVKGLAEFPGVTVNYPAKYTCPICGEEHGK